MSSADLIAQGKTWNYGKQQWEDGSTVFAPQKSAANTYAAGSGGQWMQPESFNTPSGSTSGTKPMATNYSTGVGSMPGGYSGGSSQTSGRTVSKQQSASLMQQFQTENTARNKQIQTQMTAQRKRQQELMRAARAHTQKMGAARRTEITDAGIKQQGMAQQSLISRGLGNTTIQDSVSRGINSDVSKAMTQQRDLESGRMSGLYSQEAGMQLPQAQFQLGGINMQSGGLEDYIRLLGMLGGGLS